VFLSQRSFLESAIEAFVDNNREKLDSIVRHHKSQRKRRASTSTINRLAKDFNFATSRASKTTKKSCCRRFADTSVVQSVAGKCAPPVIRGRYSLVTRFPTATRNVR
ncbi:hypothetical protein U1Q18_051953, partial [Sarracenia purpurea var. burkii]